MELYMKKSFNYLAHASCFVLGSTLAHADSDSSRGNTPDKLFKAMDTNTDGYVTGEEFNLYRSKNSVKIDFDELDSNGDRSLTLDEMKAGDKKMTDGGRGSRDSSREWSDSSRGRSTSSQANPDSSQGNMHDQMFKDMDTSSDGMITRDEFNAFGAKKFQQMDANGDGQISSEEMKAAHKKMNDGARSSGGSSRERSDNSRWRSNSSQGGSGDSGTSQRSGSSSSRSSSSGSNSSGSDGSSSSGGSGGSGN
jgi:Ca2+-binding EF-hand superfamily protein